MPDHNTWTRRAPTEEGALSAGQHQRLASERGRRALAEHDITAVYQLLKEAGVSQRLIARLTGQSQSEVSEILKGHRVMAYDVLVRIAEGLGVPRAWMGLAYDDDAESADPTIGQEVVDEDMKRRALLAAGASALVGAPVLGEVLELPTPPSTPTPLPSLLGASDVAALKEMTAKLRTVARTYGGGADVVTAVASRSQALMSVPSSDSIKDELGSVLANLHTLAGWCCVDACLHDQARACFATAMDLAAGAGDGVQMALALWHAGIHMRDAGAFNDGLKACQLGLIKLGEAPDAPGATEATAWLNVESARVLAAMGHPDAAERSLKAAREWQPATAYDDADMDCVTSYVYLWLGRLDTAEAFAANAVRKWAAEGSSRREGVLADIALATIHTKTGQSDAAVLAQRAITGVASLRSFRTRRVKLAPLVEALNARADSTTRDLARRARQLAGTTS
ncbi:MAG: helix-turn-helix transcriptional regulator [Actinomycetota bacterium]|nr:helix-turn-helix transcriptional regulator [Actinomycetota bacterium]